MSKLIFIVEDDVSIREIIRCTLSSAGNEVKEFDNAEDMFINIPKMHPDLVILDVMLPGMNGIQALKQLKISTSIPVILLTALGGEIEKVLGLDSGADDYITKPFGILELMARVRAVLRRSDEEKVQYDTLVFRDIILDKTRYEVLKDGKKVELTRKEFELLKVLMENSGRAMPRNKLLDMVWGYEYAGETRTLDMHIRTLRQKINDDAENSEYIMTVRGIGYKINS